MLKLLLLLDFVSAFWDYLRLQNPSKVVLRPLKI